MCKPMLSPKREPEAFTDSFARCAYRAVVLTMRVAEQVADHRQAVAQGKSPGGIRVTQVMQVPRR